MESIKRWYRCAYKRCARATPTEARFIRQRRETALEARVAAVGLAIVYPSSTFFQDNVRGKWVTHYIQGVSRSNKFYLKKDRAAICKHMKIHRKLDFSTDALTPASPLPVRVAFLFACNDVTF